MVGHSNSHLASTKETAWGEGQSTERRGIGSMDLGREREVGRRGSGNVETEVELVLEEEGEEVADESAVKASRPFEYPTRTLIVDEEVVYGKKTSCRCRGSGSCSLLRWGGKGGRATSAVAEERSSLPAR